MQLFRVVNIEDEVVGVEMDTKSRQIPARIKRTIELTPLFKAVVDFWESSGVRLDTALLAIFCFPNYSPALENALDLGLRTFPTSYFSTKETIISVSTDDLYTMLECCLRNMNGFDIGDSRYIWEYLWERARQEWHAGCMSRYNCLFAFREKSEAEKYLDERRKERTAGLNDIICLVDVKDNSVIETYDMRWLDNMETSATYDEYKQAVDNYWSSKTTAQPMMEILLHGVYKLTPA